MSDFYRMDPAAWDFGTTDLSLEEEAAYLRIVNAIHKHKGPVPNNDRVLAGLFRVSTRKARSLLDALIASGKVVIEDGKIWNERARSDLVQRGFVSSSRAESGAKGGRTRSERATNALKSKEPDQAIASPREEKRREENTEANASDGEAVDLAKDLFDRAVAFLGRSGVKEGSARSMVGRWRRDHADADLLSAFTECSRAGVIDPIPWITARLNKPAPFRVSFDLSKFEGMQ